MTANVHGLLVWDPVLGEQKIPEKQRWDEQAASNAFALAPPASGANTTGVRARASRRFGAADPLSIGTEPHEDSGPALLPGG
eukprot:CAMPEP_0119147440 /NCGR_PEP_ID=MMETSP1310-20130426/40380_1 /TAXON_ID=464262 /ORGANISM="Genus nov. species nov., Strain RCC2339" /LENGTH=81 /DNA_ID=CAMNT_0007139411 /DNA_START=531 /DNA_END=773 /DNA_ORIENTATION=+